MEKKERVGAYVFHFKGSERAQLTRAIDQAMVLVRTPQVTPPYLWCYLAGHGNSGMHCDERYLGGCLVLPCPYGAPYDPT